MQKKRRSITGLLLALWASTACVDKTPVLYQSDQFTIYSDKVVQGKYEARALSSTHLVSDYQSTANENYSRLITFKFSINEKDNEMPSGTDHWIVVGDEQQSPLLQFGTDNGPVPSNPGTKLPANYRYTFRVDMNPVLNQFREKGYYEAFDGSRISKTDFKAVYIAGGSEPLTWDFSNLEENKLALKDPDQDGIYELTVLLNPLGENQDTKNKWILSSNITAKPRYQSEQTIVDALFNLSLEEALLNIEKDSTFRTGAKWEGVWTRDISYSIWLAFAYLEPEVAKISLMRKVQRDRIIQDTGSGGAWPVSSDRVVWSLAAWEIYKVTGDRKWLSAIYPIIKNTLDDDFKTLYSTQTGMFKGESSFLDWREQTYPRWMNNSDIYQSENLGTNVLHYQAHVILSQMAEMMGGHGEIYFKRAQEIKRGILQHLWMPEKGYFAQYLYGRDHLMQSPRFEALGEALAILFDVPDSEQIGSIVEKSPLTTFGVSCIYPQIPGIPPYHNNAVWPFVQSYWNLAAAKAGNEKALTHGLAAIYRAGALFLTNYENFVASNGDYVGTEINSHRMLWSMAGNLAMVHRVFMGMSFTPEGIKFNPVVPRNYPGTKKLSNFKYRKSELDITVEGVGKTIASITLDGNPLEQAFLPGNLSGKHSIVIRMDGDDFSAPGINLVENHFSLPNPKAVVENDRLKWAPVDGAKSYQIIKNGKIITETPNTEFQIDGLMAEYAVIAKDGRGVGSFASEPVRQQKDQQEIRFEMEQLVPSSSLPYTNFSGKGFVEISKQVNREINIPVYIEKPGKYLIECRYANGTGPWNTDNNCAIRSLYKNDQYVGVLVFPQRGTDEWSDWGMSNSLTINLEKGKNQLKLKLEDWNTNMDGETNQAMLDYIRLVIYE